MKYIFKNPIKISILLYSIVVLYILYKKSDVLFDEFGYARGFGCSDDCEFFNLPVLLFTFVIIITFIVEALCIYYT